MIDLQAQAAYEAFSVVRRGYRKLPPWALALDHDRDAWRAVARAVLATMPQEGAASPDITTRRTTACPDGVRDCNCAKMAAAR